MNRNQPTGGTVQPSVTSALLLVVMLVGSPALAAIFWEDNFENGLHQWDITGCQNGGNPPADPAIGCNPAISSNRFSSATRSLKTQFNYSNPEIQQGTYYSRGFTPTSDVWARAWIRLEGPNGVGPFTPSSIQTKHFILWSGTPGVGVWLVNQWGSHNLSMYVVNSPNIDDAYVEPTGATLNDYQWYCAEVHFNRGSRGQTNGQLELYIDGTRVYNKVGVVFDNNPDICPPNSTCAGQQVLHTFGNFRLFAQYGMGDRYFDDVAVGTTRIGCAPGQGGGGSPDTTPPTIPMNLLVR